MLYSVHVMGKLDLRRDLLQGLDLHKKVTHEGLLSRCILQLAKAFCMLVLPPMPAVQMARQTSFGAKPISLAVDPNEAFLYILCADRTLRVFVIDYFSGGHLAQVGSPT